MTLLGIPSPGQETARCREDILRHNGCSEVEIQRSLLAQREWVVGDRCPRVDVEEVGRAAVALIAQGWLLAALCHLHHRVCTHKLHRVEVYRIPLLALRIYHIAR